jgi:hypothetical protein
MPSEIKPDEVRTMRYRENACQNKKPGALATLLIAAGDAGPMKGTVT